MAMASVVVLFAVGGLIALGVLLAGIIVFVGTRKRDVVPPATKVTNQSSGEPTGDRGEPHHNVEP